MNVIYAQKNGKMTEADRLALGDLLLKAGYSVHLTKMKDAASGKSFPAIQFKGDNDAQ